MRGPRVTRRTLLAAGAVLALVRPAPVGASQAWCSSDPLVTITTPAGAQVSLSITLGALGAPYLPELEAAQIGWSVQAAAGGKATTVSMTILVPTPPLPAAPFPVAVGASAGPAGDGTIYGLAAGVSGQTLGLAFRLPVG